jgi:hypothetical protein
MREREGLYVNLVRGEVPRQYVDSNEHNDTRKAKLVCEREFQSKVTGSPK